MDFPYPNEIKKKAWRNFGGEKIGISGIFVVKKTSHGATVATFLKELSTENGEKKHVFELLTLFENEFGPVGSVIPAK